MSAFRSKRTSIEGVPMLASYAERTPPSVLASLGSRQMHQGMAGTGLKQCPPNGGPPPSQRRTIPV